MKPVNINFWCCLQEVFENINKGHFVSKQPKENVEVFENLLLSQYHIQFINLNDYESWQDSLKGNYVEGLIVDGIHESIFFET